MRVLLSLPPALRPSTCGCLPLHLQVVILPLHQCRHGLSTDCLADLLRRSVQSRESL